MEWIGVTGGSLRSGVDWGVRRGVDWGVRRRVDWGERRGAAAAHRDIPTACSPRSRADTGHSCVPSRLADTRSNRCHCHRRS